MIHRRNISLISNLILEKTGKKVPDNIIERDYCISWFLFGLAQSEIRKNFVFKGGTALRRCHYEDYRFSEDLDFSIKENITFKEIQIKFEEIFKYIENESNIKFSFGTIEEPTRNTYTFYLNYIGPLPGNARSAKVDITFNELLLFPVLEKPIIKTYEHYSDFLIEPTIFVYSLEEITTEKVCTLTDKSRNEPRDLYDIYFLLTEKNIDLFGFIDKIKEKMAFKGDPFEARIGQFDKKESRLKGSWETRLSEQMTSLPDFDTVFKLVKQKFTEAGLRIED